MTIRRRWFVDFTAANPSGGGGTSSLWFQSDTGTTAQGDQIQAVLDAWAPLANNQFTATVQDVADLVEDTTGDKVGEDSISSPPSAVGSAVQGLMPNQTQLVVGLRTSTFILGRRLRGRVFFAGLDRSASVGGEPDEPAVQTIADAMVGIGMVVFSPTHLTSDLVTSARPFSEWAVLRRRRD